VDFLAIPVVNFVFYFATAIGLAMGSWYLLERPVNRLRRRITNTVIQKWILAKKAVVSTQNIDDKN
jgi:peptidoglycan/LPS O-acetylase OafA/YrhL